MKIAEWSRCIGDPWGFHLKKFYFPKIENGHVVLECLDDQVVHELHPGCWPSSTTVIGRFVGLKSILPITGWCDDGQHAGVVAGS